MTMTPLETTIATLLTRMGFNDSRVTIDNDHRKVSIFIEDEMVRPHVATLITSLDHIVNLMLRRDKLPTHIIDVNLYRRERERLIVELARAAARKAVVSKDNIELPPMNAYERRLVHMEITTHPELKTESIGIGKERRVIIKVLT